MENNNIIEEVVQRLQDKLKPFIFEYISEFVKSEYIPKDKTGKEMMACLNHHNKGLDKKHKHLKYYPETGTFHCFACGANFNIFKLANLFENKPMKGKDFFTENIKYLCDKFGIDSTELDDLKIGNVELKNAELFRINKEISEYITANYNSKFLEKRKIKLETAALFNVGGILDEDDFEKFLLQFDTKFLEELNIYNEKGEVNKRLFSKTKLIFSLKDINGNVIGFSSREMFYTLENAKKLLKDFYNFNDNVLKNINNGETLKKFIDIQNMEDKHIKFFKRTATIPKYVNSKENSIFKKRNMLYGFSEIKNNLNKSSSLHLIEGVVDVITAYQKKIYCVGVGGTSFTEEQFELLETKVNKHCDNIILAFDNDEAGENATFKYVNSILEKLKKGTIYNKYSILKYKTTLKDIDENLKTYDNIYDFSEQLSMFQYFLNKKIINNYKEEGEKDEDIINDFIKLISIEESPLNRKQMMIFLFETLEQKSKEENKEHFWTLKDIENEVNFIVNKHDEIMKKQISKEINNFTKKLKDLKPDEIKSALGSMMRNIEEIDDNINKGATSIFDVSLNRFRENQETKYTEKPTDFNCGFDMFDNRSWTGDEFMIIIAKPHIGKTQFMVNISRNYLELNDDTAVLYISTDDSSRRIENNFLAQIGNLNKDFVNEPVNNKFFGLNSNYKNKALYQEEFKKTKIKIENLMRSKRLVILDSSLGAKTLDSLVGAIIEFCNDKTIKELKKLVIIDSANKVNIPGTIEEYSKLVMISSYLKSIGQKNHCMIMANFETKKFSSRRTKTSFNSIKGSSSIEYDVDFAVTLSNPLSELQNANTVWLDHTNKPQPVLVPYVSKSKPGGEIAKAYFYKIDNQTTKMSTFSDDDLKDIKTKWVSDNTDKENGYYNE